MQKLKKAKFFQKNTYNALGSLKDLLSSIQEDMKVSPSSAQVYAKIRKKLQIYKNRLQILSKRSKRSFKKFSNKYITPTAFERNLSYLYTQVHFSAEKTRKSKSKIFNYVQKMRIKPKRTPGYTRAILEKTFRAILYKPSGFINLFTATAVQEIYRLSRLNLSRKKKYIDKALFSDKYRGTHLSNKSKRRGFPLPQFQRKTQQLKNNHLHFLKIKRKYPSFKCIYTNLAGDETFLGHKPFVKDQLYTSIAKKIQANDFSNFIRSKDRLVYGKITKSSNWSSDPRVYYQIFTNQKHYSTIFKALDRSQKLFIRRQAFFKKIIKSLFINHKVLVRITKNNYQLLLLNRNNRFLAEVPAGGIKLYKPSPHGLITCRMPGGLRKRTETFEKVIKKFLSQIRIKHKVTSCDIYFVTRCSYILYRTIKLLKKSSKFTIRYLIYHRKFGHGKFMRTKQWRRKKKSKFFTQG